jgi:proline dehydrogenase
MLRDGLLFLSNSRTARRLLTLNPLTRALSRRFVPGESVDALVDAIRSANAEGLKVTANYLGEAVKNRETARAAADRYIQVLDRVSAEGLDANVSLKFTQMGQDIDEAFLQENLGRVLERAKEAGIFIRFDMESSAYTQRTLDAFEALWARGWRDIGVVLQAYLERTEGDVARMTELGARVRLCKGAYAEPPEVALQDMPAIRENFVRLMRPLLLEGKYPGIATHDEELIAAALELVDSGGISRSDFEFQMLYGVRRDLQRRLVDNGFNMRVYIPFGEMWYPYLMRRLAERPENIAFMVGSVVKESPLGFFLGNGALGKDDAQGMMGKDDAQGASGKDDGQGATGKDGRQGAAGKENGRGATGKNDDDGAGAGEDR